LNGKTATVEEELRSWCKVTFIIHRAQPNIQEFGGRVPDMGLLENA